MSDLLRALVLGVVEGLTEFLPISSTGHLILAGELLNASDERWNVFNIVIQTGAMLAVVWEYRARFFRIDVNLYRNLIVAFIPAAVLGLLFSKYIKSYLFHAVPVALAFIIGGVVILIVERRSFQPRVETAQSMTWLDALKVGIAQCFALIPGTSRSGATIIGAMLFGLSRKAATEFSFFLAVPTLIAAGAYDFWKNRDLFSAQDLEILGVGLVAAFVSAFLCIRWLLRYVERFLGGPVADLRLVGGGAASALWCQIHADVLGRTVRQVEDPLLANVRGAGLVGAAALGLLAFDEVPGCVPVAATFEPDRARRRLYDALFEAFLRLYRATRHIHPRLDREEEPWTSPPSEGASSAASTPASSPPPSGP